MKLYLQIASQVQEHIDKGLFRPGEKLPSVRKLSDQMEVSISTVIQAYARLEDQEVIEAVPQSGYYVRRGPRVVPDPPAISEPAAEPTEVSISKLAMEMLHAGYRSNAVQFGTAVPCIEFPAVRQLHRNYAKIVRRHPNRVGSYEIPPGAPELRLQIARRAVDAGVSVSPDDIVITSGCQEALLLAIRAVAKAGDTMAVESPGYYGTLQSMESLGIRVLEIPTDPVTGISIDALKLALEQWPIKAVLVTPQFSNPLGYRMPDQNKIALMKLVQQYDIALVEDDINGELCFDDHRARAIKSWDRGGRVLFCSSISKTLEPGLRIGWIMPGRHFDTVEHLKVTSSMATATIPQLIVADFLEAGGFDRHLRSVRVTYHERRDQLIKLIREMMPEGTRVTHPEGGYLAWLELDEQVDSLALFRKALRLGISTAPGPLFSATGKYRNFLRINYAAPWTDARIAGFRTLCDLVHEQLKGSARKTAATGS